MKGKFWLKGPVFILFSATLVGCGGVVVSALLGESSNIREVDVSPATATIEPGGSVVLTASARSLVGKVLGGVNYQWTVERGRDLIVNPEEITLGGNRAQVTARSDLTASQLEQNNLVIVKVTASGGSSWLGISSGSASATATITIVMPGSNVLSVAVFPDVIGLQPGMSQQFIAFVTDSKGFSRDQTAQAAEWQLSDPRLGSVNLQTGLFTAAASLPAGEERLQGSLTAQVGQASGQATVILKETVGTLGEEPVVLTVYPQQVKLPLAGTGKENTQRFLAVAQDKNGNTVPLNSLTWELQALSHSNVGTINPSTGVFTSGTVSGTGTVVALAQTATGQDLRGTAELRVGE
ncbi:MAG TPA: hypothetical protein EYP85_16865 [Armatimonadetes bacterium]|nr:hypothetical protein [Armatimonadota bacterium]